VNWGNAEAKGNRFVKSLQRICAHDHVIGTNAQHAVQNELRSVLERLA
jgi:hypothetical protein